MKVKTNIKAGADVKVLLSQGEQTIKQAGQKAGEVAQDVAGTVTNPKFWTWPW